MQGIVKCIDTNRGALLAWLLNFLYVQSQKLIISCYCVFSEVAGCKFIGCPKCIEDNKYERNAFMFNFVFVFESSTDTSPYEAVILKMGNAFKSYEVC